MGATAAIVLTVSEAKEFQQATSIVLAKNLQKEKVAEVVKVPTLHRSLAKSWRYCPKVPISVIPA